MDEEFPYLKLVCDLQMEECKVLEVLPAPQRLQAGQRAGQSMRYCSNAGFGGNAISVLL